MNPTEDPLKVNDLLKSATIYRSSEFNYIYVCYHCECTFTNILDTSNHIEGHFDVKVIIFDDDSEHGAKIPEIVDEIDKKTMTNLLMEDVNPMKLCDDNEPDDLEFVCKIVEQKFKYTEDDVQDIKTDFNEVIQEDCLSQCKLCDEKFNSAPVLTIHMMKNHAKISELSCPQCSQTSTNESTFSRHLQQHIDDNETTLDALIDKLMSKSTSRSKRKKNANIETQQRRWTKYQLRFLKTCDICLSTFSNRKPLIAHMRKEHSGKRFMYDCDKCNRAINGKFLLYAHHYGHLTNGDQVNDFDDETLRKNLRKFLDENIHCDESTSTFDCKLCGHLSLTLQKSIEYHILQNHIYFVKANNEKKFQCDFCGWKFSNSRNLDNHKRTHMLDKPYSCSICHKSFSHTSYLKTHNLTHTELKPYQCSSCGDTFKSLARMNCHNRKIHLSVTTKCSICHKELKNIKQHMQLVHGNEHRPYSCSVCMQAFKTTKTLKIHSLRHGGEKKYECRFHCKGKFISAAGRRAHERSKHEPK